MPSRKSSEEKHACVITGGMHSAFEKTPHCILKLLIERLVSYGLTLTRTSNCWNDYSAFKEEIDDLKKTGMDTVANLIYSVSPRHTDEYYARKAQEAAAAKPWRICFKDVGGLLTPQRARTLIPVVLKAAGNIPVEFHAHCNSGQAPLIRKASSSACASFIPRSRRSPTDRRSLRYSTSPAI